MPTYPWRYDILLVMWMIKINLSFWTCHKFSIVPMDVSKVYIIDFEMCSILALKTNFFLCVIKWV